MSRGILYELLNLYYQNEEYVSSIMTEDGCTLDDYDIEYIINSINWSNVPIHPLSEEFMRYFLDKLDFDDLIIMQHLSENFIREFIDDLDLILLVIYQKLSEDFIRENKDILDWCLISEYQDLSDEFINEFKDYINPISNT